MVFVQQTSALTSSNVNDKLLALWVKLSDDEKIVYSKVARNEILLMQGKEISTSPPKSPTSAAPQSVPPEVITLFSHKNNSRAKLSHA